MEPLGFVAWGSTIAELYPNGSWQCLTAGEPDRELERNLRSAYGNPSGRAEDGHFGPSILERLAQSVGGEWVYWPVHAEGLIR
jgi:hypothetical protein